GSLAQGDVSELGEGKPGGHPLGMNPDAEGSGTVAAGVGLFQIITAVTNVGGKVAGKILSKAAKPAKKLFGGVWGRLKTRIRGKGPGKGTVDKSTGSEFLDDAVRTGQPGIGIDAAKEAGTKIGEGLRSA